MRLYITKAEQEFLKTGQPLLVVCENGPVEINFEV